MRRAISIVTVATLIFIVVEVIVAHGKTVADYRPTKSEFHKQVLIDGLHVAVPPTIKDFPMEFVPRP